jgi:propanol-preferring alcohol dehydrogenase
MRVVLLPGDKQVVVTEYPDPTPGPGEVLVAMRAAGVCGSDLHLYRATGETRQPVKDVVPGHEPAGVIVALGTGVTGWKVGERVVVNVPVGCGRCEYCKQGITVSCKDRGKRGITLFGSDADLMVAPAVSLLLLPEEMSYTAGMLCACNIGTAYQTVKRLDLSGRDLVVVFGAGPVGCSTLMLAKATGCRVIVVDVSKGRREFARALGADVLLNPKEVDVATVVMDLTQGRGADVAIDTSGSPSAQATMLDTLAYWGRAAFVGMQPGAITATPNKIIERQLTIIGSAYWPLGIWGEMARFVLDRGLPIERLVSYRLSLGQASEGFRIADAANEGKVAFVWAD